MYDRHECTWLREAAHFTHRPIVLAHKVVAVPRGLVGGGKVIQPLSFAAAGERSRPTSSRAVTTIFRTWNYVLVEPEATADCLHLGTRSAMRCRPGARH